MDEQGQFFPQEYITTNTPKLYFAEKDLFEAIKENEKSFSQELKFGKNLSYDEKHEIWHERQDGPLDHILDVFVNLGVEEQNVLYNLLSEPVRNIADHGGDRGYIDMQYLVDSQKNQVHFHFSILDNGKGFSFDEDTIQKIFDGIYNRPVDYGWKQVGKENGGMGLMWIRDISKNYHIDLRLHHHGKLFPINNLGLQPHLKDSDFFGYEGYGIFDMKTPE